MSWELLREVNTSFGSSYEGYGAGNYARVQFEGEVSDSDAINALTHIINQNVEEHDAILLGYKIYVDRSTSPKTYKAEYYFTSPSVAGMPLSFDSSGSLIVPAILVDLAIAAGEWLVANIGTILATTFGLIVFSTVMDKINTFVWGPTAAGGEPGIEPGTEQVVTPGPNLFDLLKTYAPIAGIALIGYFILRWKELNK